jgi:hypothetical protein
LQPTWVAWSPWPESRTIKSGVTPTHQFGGSTFVTTGAAVAAVDCGEPLLRGAAKKNTATKSVEARRKFDLIREQE